MPTPHKNFRPPAGSVIDLNDSRLTWDGNNWKLNGKKHTVPSSHQLIGKPGGPLAGWKYDWKQKAWMQPDAVAPRPSTPRPMPGRPSTPFRPSTPRPPIAPRPTTPNPVPQQPVVQPGGTMTFVKPETAFQALLAHPVAPLIGGGLIAISKFTEGPVPPPLSDQLTENERTETVMKYQQNQSRFTQRMELYATLGMALLGHAETQAVFTALSSGVPAANTNGYATVPLAPPRAA